MPSDFGYDVRRIQFGFTFFKFSFFKIMQKKSIMVPVLLIATVIVLSGQSHAGVILADDFNDGSTSGWTIQNGSVVESGGFQSGLNLSLATMDGMSGKTIAADVTTSGGISYAALVLNFNDIDDNLFIKLQDNNRNGLFDRLFFYRGNNASSSNMALVGGSFFELSTEVSSTYFEVSDNGDGTASAFIGATGETFGGTLAHTYSGSNVGLGYYGNGRADNFYVGGEVPEPGTLAIFGAICLVGMVRRRQS